MEENEAGMQIRNRSQGQRNFRGSKSQGVKGRQSCVLEGQREGQPGDRHGGSGLSEPLWKSPSQKLAVFVKHQLSLQPCVGRMVQGTDKVTLSRR